MLRVGFNVINDDANIQNIIRELSPRWSLFMSSMDAAMRAMGAGRQVIYRHYHIDDGVFWRLMSPRGYVNYITAATGQLNRDVWLQVLNEPGHSADEAEALCDWLVEVGQMLLDDGRRMVLGNFGVGVYNIDAVKAGRYDALLKFVHENRDRVRMGLHEYAPGTLFNWGGGGMPLDVQYNPNVQYRPSSDAGYHDNHWYLFRLTNFNSRCRELGFIPVPIVITEFGWDDIPGVDYTFVDQYTGGKHRGIGHLRPYWRGFAFEGMTGAEAMLVQLQFAEDNYPPNVEGLLLFAWANSANEWNREHGFDYANDPDVARAVLGALKPAEEEGGFVVKMVKSIGTVTNIRRQPTTQSDIVGWIGSEFIRVSVGESALMEDGRWWHVIVDDDVMGYVREDVVVFEEVEAPTPSVTLRITGGNQDDLDVFSEIVEDIALLLGWEVDVQVGG